LRQNVLQGYAPAAMHEARTIIPGFVVLEGIDGSGTTTQLARLARRLDGAGLPHAESFEPTTGPVGRLLREALSGSFAACPETVARLFAADRGEHICGTGGILELTSGGTLAISDRYLFSSLAYQGLTCGPELPASLNAPFPLPELVLFFELDPQTAMERMSSRTAFEIYENLEFQRRVAAAYTDVMDSFQNSGMTIVRIAANETPDRIEETIWSGVEPLARRLTEAR
jgi:dTMP kinase